MQQLESRPERGHHLLGAQLLLPLREPGRDHGDRRAPQVHLVRPSPRPAFLSVADLAHSSSACNLTRRHEPASRSFRGGCQTCVRLLPRLLPLADAVPIAVLPVNAAMPFQGMDTLALRPTPLDPISSRRIAPLIPSFSPSRPLYFAPPPPPPPPPLHRVQFSCSLQRERQRVPYSCWAAGTSMKLQVHLMRNGPRGMTLQSSLAQQAST